jgi:hypothetical protein
MRIAEILTAMASWLESPHNEAMLLAEGDDHCLKVVAESCVLAAELLKKAADEVDLLEAPTESVITPESIEETAALASALDATNDPQLKKMASVLDELLLTIAAPENEMLERKQYGDKRIEELRKKYQGNSEDLHTINRISESEKAIDKSNFTKHYKVNDHPLNTRSCPVHLCQMSRVGESQYQCELAKEIYDWANGYTNVATGEKVPGGSVALQTADLHNNFHSIFDTRSERLGYHQ